MTIFRTVPGLMLAALAAASSQAAQPRPEIRLPAASASPTLTELAAAMPAEEASAMASFMVPRRHVTPAMKGFVRQGTLQGKAPASALHAGGAAATSGVLTTGTRINIEGIPANGVAPSDTNGTPGATQYVQWVNRQLAVYNKADGALLLGPVPGNVLFAGMTGSPGADACRRSNFGDPIAQYDKHAKRWVLTQFGWDPANTATGPYYQCIAVSTSPDATGSYYRYALEIRTAGGAIAFNDYPKLGVWPDAYVLTSVLFEGVTEGDYLGPQVCGLERAAMLRGAAAAVRCFDLGAAFGPALPSDLDGAKAPPRGSPNYLMSLDFNESGSGDHLFLWRFSFTRNTVSSPVTIPVAPFTIACPTSFGAFCIEQPAPGERLDALGDRLMYRLAYRNFGKHEALVVNHSVQQPGAPTDGPAGVRWYELRKLSTTPGVYQQGTWAPDANSRWMGSIAMDRKGNIALGYSVSGPAVFPGVRYTGRLRIAPPGRLGREAVIVDGGGVQVDTFGRWGDYSAMTIDPVGDCRLWYTQQYQGATGRFNWRTRIANFRFLTCW